MKNVTSKFLLILLTGIQVNAQSTFQKSYPGAYSAYSIVQTDDYGFVFTGYSGSTIHLTKIDENSNILWSKNYSSIISPTDGHQLQVTKDKGFILLGHTQSFLGNGDIFFVKTNSVGDTLFTRVFGTSEPDFPSDVKETSDGGFIITGKTYNSWGGKIFLLKTNSAGNIEWSKSYDDSTLLEAFAVEQTADEGYILTGRILNSGTTYDDILIIKTDNNGDMLWTKIYGGTGTGGEWCKDIHKTNDNSYILVGETSSYGAGQTDVLLMKIDSLGTILWAKTYGGPYSDPGNSVKQTTDGGYIIAGTQFMIVGGSNDVYLIKTDSVGDTLWTRKYGGDFTEGATCVEQTFDGGYILSGATNSFVYSAGGQPDPYILKTDSNGNIGCFQYETITSVGSASFNNINSQIISSSISFVTLDTSCTITDGINSDSTICLTVGLDQYTESSEEKRVYPNPNDGLFYVSLNNTNLNVGKRQIEILNLLGERVYYSTILPNGTNQNINITDQPAGTYILRILSSKQVYTTKILRY